MACSPLVLLGEACPKSLREALESGPMFEALNIVRPLQYTSTSHVNVCGVSCAKQAEPQLCVVKSYLKLRLEPEELQQVYREVHLHQQLQRSPHTVPFWAAVDDGAQLHIILQHCSQGDLRGLMADGPVSEAVLRQQVVLPLLLALQDLHSKGVVHRDVKPDNVFLLDGGSALLGDFGLAVALPTSKAIGDAGGLADASGSGGSSMPGSPAFLRLAGRSARCSSDSSSSGSNDGASLSPTSRDGAGMESDGCGGSSGSSGSLGRLLACGGSGGICRSLSLDSSKDGGCAALAVGGGHAGGTPAYCAPEVVQAAFNQLPLEDALGPQNDVWSLGVLVLECLAGAHPFGHADAPPGQVLAAISKGRPLQLSTLAVSESCRDWLAAALARDPRQRWSAARLLQHAWVAQAPPQSAGPATCGGGGSNTERPLAGASSTLPWGAAACCAAGQHGATAAERCAREEGGACGWGSATPAEAAAASDGFEHGGYAGGSGAADTAWPWPRAPCKQQQRQQANTAASVLARCGLGGITSWED